MPCLSAFATRGDGEKTIHVLGMCVPTRKLKHGFLDLEVHILDLEVQILDLEVQILDLEVQILDLEVQILDLWSTSLILYQHLGFSS